MMGSQRIQQIANSTFSTAGYPLIDSDAAATLSIVLVAAALYLLFHSNVWSRRRDTIILTGLRGSGKTVLVCQLRDGVFKDRTVQTSEPNEESFVLHSETSTWKGKSKPVRVVDLPGNSKIGDDDNSKYLDTRAAGVVFVVDATEFVWNYLSDSEYLQEILTNTAMIKRKIPLLILCNKTDKLTAHTTPFIITQLQNQIDKLHSSTSKKANNGCCIYEEVLPGEGRKAFPFSNCKVSVSIAESSGFTGDVYHLETFIRKHAKR